MASWRDVPPSDEAAWYATLRRRLESGYLATPDPRRGSGVDGDEAYWERARRPIAAAIHRDGTLLDVGCANGLLMESLAAWAAAAGHRVEPHGLDFSAALAALARRRLPHWADRIYVGNVVDWQPPSRFDFVRTELVYVPPPRQQALVARLLAAVVVPGGRLIVCSYGSSTRPVPRAESVGDRLRAWGYAVAGEAEGVAANGVTITRVAWIDGAADARGS